MSSYFTLTFWFSSCVVQLDLIWRRHIYGAFLCMYLHIYTTYICIDQDLMKSVGINLCVRLWEVTQVQIYLLVQEEMFSR